MTSSAGSTDPLPEVAAFLAAAAAVFAPVTLTGSGPIDAVQRFAITGFAAYVGSYGRRWSWLAAAMAIAIPARGVSLTLTLVALVIFVVSTIPQHRPRIHGAIGIGLLANALFWYPSSTSTIGAVLGTAGLAFVVICAFPQMRSHKRKVVRRVLVGLGALVVLAGVGAGVAALLAYTSVRSGSDAAQQALESARDGDADAARAALDEAQASFDRASSAMNGPLAAPAALVPGVAQQVEAVQVTIKQGKRISATGDDLVATADYDSLQYKGRLDLAQIEQLAGPADRASGALAEARGELDEVRQGSLLPPLRERLDTFVEKVDEAQRDTSLASALLKTTPGLFGADGDRHYLVIFTTPAELRGGGGFIGDFAELTATDGKVELTRSGGITELIDAAEPGTRQITGPNDYLRRYGRFNPQDFLQDVTFSPNFPSNAAVMRQLYPQSGGRPVDGVISLDPTGMAALLTFTGPIEVPGLAEPLSADTAVDTLTRKLYIDVPNNAEQTKILAEATRLTFEQLIDSSLPAPRKLATTLSPAARAGHLRLWSPDEQEQELFVLLGADGTLAIPPGSDGFSLVQQNTGNNKIDAYLHRSIRYDATVDAKTGRLTAKVHIELRNDVPSLDLPPAVVDNTRAAPPGTNVAIISLFTPHAITGAKLDGAALKLGPSVEQGLNAYDTPIIEIPPGKTVVIDLELAGGVDLRDGYHLRILPQPAANADQMTASVTIRGGYDTDTGRSRVVLVEDRPVTKPTDHIVKTGR